MEETFDGSKLFVWEEYSGSLPQSVIGYLRLELCGNHSEDNRLLGRIPVSAGIGL